MLYIIILGLFASAMILPLKHSFGVNLAAAFLFIVPFGKDVTTYFFLLILIRFLFTKVVKKGKVKYDPFMLLFIGLLTFSIPSYIYFGGVSGMEYLRRYFMTIVIIFLFVNIYSTVNDLKLFAKYFLAGVLLLSIHIYTQTIIPINPFAQAEFTPKELRLLPSGMANQYVNSNTMGALLVWGFGFVTGFYTLFYSKYIKRFNRGQITWIIIGGIALLINVSILLGMLGSRSNFLILVFVALIVLFRLNLKTLITRIIIWTFPIFLLISPILANPTIILENLSPTNPLASLAIRFVNAKEEQKKEDTHSRSYLAKTGMKIFLDHPIVGVGIGNEAKMMRQYGGVGLISHNTYLGLLIEMGLIGLLFMLAVFGYWIPYIKDGFALSLIVMIGFYAFVHSILLMSVPWLLMSFYYKSYQILK